MSYASNMLSPLPGESKWVQKPVSGPQITPQEPEQRERGASNLSMTDFGRHQMQVKGAGFARQIRATAVAHSKMPDVHIHSSAWDRTQESANTIHEQLSNASVRPDLNEIPELAPQSLGELEGQPSDKVHDEIESYRTEHRDVPMPGISPLTGQRGEAYDHYVGRVQPAIRGLMEDSAKNPNTVHIVAAHSSDMRAAHEMLDPSYDPGSERIEPGRTDLIHVDNDGQFKYVPDVTIGGNHRLVPGVYLQHHGATEFSSARPGMYVEDAIRNILPDREKKIPNPTNPSQGGQSSGTPAASAQY